MISVFARQNVIPTPTPTPTPSTTPSVTPTNTPTVTPTPSNSPCLVCGLAIQNIVSNTCGGRIDGVTVNSIPVTYQGPGGSDFPLSTGTGGSFCNNQISATANVEITYSGLDAGCGDVKLVLTDCKKPLGTVFCADFLSTPSGIVTFTNVQIDCNCDWTITFEDGTC